jgi:hypothetical protein
VQTLWLGPQTAGFGAFEIQTLRVPSNALQVLSQTSVLGYRLSMPIRPQFRWFYPIDWRELSIVIRFERAKGRCERCARPHGQIVICFGDGRWWDAECGGWRDGQGRPLRHGPETISLTEIRSTRVYLATAHLDHDPANNRPRNLKALCQRCHMLHDQNEHRRQRWLTLRMRKSFGDLFTGPYKFG